MPVFTALGPSPPFISLKCLALESFLMRRGSFQLRGPLTLLSTVDRQSPRSFGLPSSGRHVPKPFLSVFPVDIECTHPCSGIWFPSFGQKPHADGDWWLPPLISSRRCL